MKQILQYEILDNTIAAYGFVFATILMIFFIRKLISKFIAGRILNVIIGKKYQLKKEAFLSLVIKPIEKFLLAFIIITALDKLYFPEAFSFTIYHVAFEEIIKSIAAIIMVVVIIQLCIRIMEFIAMILEEKANLNEHNPENQLIIFFKDFFKAILIIAGVLLVLHFAFHKNITNIFTGLSIVGAALALAAKESLENLIASFIIFFDRPFVTGDTVKVLNITGSIEKIGLRSTRIRTDQKTYITVPNKQMVDTITDNITLRTQRRADINLEVSLTTSIEGIKKLKEQIEVFLANEIIVEQYSVFLLDTGKNAHVIHIEYYTSILQSFLEFNILKEKINLSIIEALNTSQIRLASMDNLCKN